jgi:hypothetical protein
VKKRKNEKIIDPRIIYDDENIEEIIIAIYTVMSAAYGPCFVSAENGNAP